MKRKLVILATVLTMILLLIGCSASSGEGGGALLGRNVFSIRTASDEEAFEQSEDGYMEVPDEIVPLASLPTDSDEGWILVRYVGADDGDPSLLWYRVWTEDGWSDISVPYDGTDWHPEIP